MKTRVLLLLGLLVVSTVLCQAESKKPLFASPDFNPALIDRIDVFVVDLRNDTAKDGECVAGAKFGTLRVRGGADVSLGKRGYNKEKHSRTRFYSAPIPLTEAMLSNPTKEWLQDLANRKYSEKSKEVPSPGQWIMILTIDELGSRENSIKGPGRATLSMYLYDRDQGTLLWHDQASDQMWGGLLGNLVEKGQMKAESCGIATYSMIIKLPKHAK